MSQKKWNRMVVKSLVQKALFDWELMGQISDGQWENATPHSHWEQWAATNVIVDPEGEPRVNFYPIRKYDLTNKGLLDCVGDRMLFYARLARLYPDLVQSLFDNGIRPCDSLKDYEWHEQHVGLSDYYAKVWEDYARLGLTREVVVNVMLDRTYDMKELRKDLRELKAAMQTVRWEPY